MFNSQTLGVSTEEMKSQTSCTTSTMYSLAPMPSNGGISYVGSLSPETFKPQPLCEKPTTPPCSLPHLRIGRSQVGHSPIWLVLVPLKRPLSLRKFQLNSTGCG